VNLGWTESGSGNSGKGENGGNHLIYRKSSNQLAVVAAGRLAHARRRSVNLNDIHLDGSAIVGKGRPRRQGSNRRKHGFFQLGVLTCKSVSLEAKPGSAPRLGLLAAVSWASLPASRAPPILPVNDLLTICGCIWFKRAFSTICPLTWVAMRRLSFYFTKRDHE
jgi:hypothetical protein